MNEPETIEDPWRTPEDTRWMGYKTPVEFMLESGETKVVQCPRCGGGYSAPRVFVKWRSLPPVEHTSE